MSIDSLRNNIINLISETNNFAMLKDIGKIVSISSISEDEIKLTEYQLKEINEAIEQIEKQEFLTHQEAKNKTSEWLNQ